MNRRGGFTLIEALVAGFIVLLLGSGLLAVMMRAWQNQDAIVIQNEVQQSARAALDLACDSVRNITYWDYQSVSAYSDGGGSVVGGSTVLPGGLRDSFLLRRNPDLNTLRRTSNSRPLQSTIADITAFAVTFQTRASSADGNVAFVPVSGIVNDPNGGEYDSRLNRVCTVYISVTAARQGFDGQMYSSTLATAVKVRNQFYTVAPPRG